VLFDEELMDQ